MTGTGLAANVVAGVLALGLVVYLFVALIRPDRDMGAKPLHRRRRSGDGSA